MVDSFGSQQLCDLFLAVNADSMASGHRDSKSLPRPSCAPSPRPSRAPRHSTSAQLPVQPSTPSSSLPAQPPVQPSTPSSSLPAQPPVQATAHVLPGPTPFGALPTMSSPMGMQWPLFQPWLGMWAAHWPAWQAQSPPPPPPPPPPPTLPEQTIVCSRVTGLYLHSAWVLSFCGVV